jgi:hypothetical protein
MEAMLGTIAAPLFVQPYPARLDLGIAGFRGLGPVTRDRMLPSCGRTEATAGPAGEFCGGAGSLAMGARRLVGLLSL